MLKKSKIGQIVLKNEIIGFSPAHCQGPLAKVKLGGAQGNNDFESIYFAKLKSGGFTIMEIMMKRKNIITHME